MNDDWDFIVKTLGGPAVLERTAREAGAFTRSRQIKTAEDLLRLCFAYGPGQMSLRTTSAWAQASGLAKLSDVAVMERLQKSADWLSVLIGQMLSNERPRAAKGRLIRLVDGSVISKAGIKTRSHNGVWRLHASFDLGAERFDHLELTDERGGERFDRAPVVPGEIRIGDRAYLQPDRIAHVISQGGDVIVRAPWKNARWLDENKARFNIIDALISAKNTGALDIPIALGRKGADPVTGLRLVAFRKPERVREASRKTARKEARKGGHTITPQTLVAAEWVILVTSLDIQEFHADDIAVLYRLRWRIELAFKRLKSLIGLTTPPGRQAALARTFLLAHLLLAILIELSSPQWFDSPPWAEENALGMETHQDAVKPLSSSHPTMATHTDPWQSRAGD